MQHFCPWRDVFFTQAPFPPTFYRKKSCRNITYDEFKLALGELARKKYKDKTAEEAEAEVFKLIEGKSPIISGVTVRLDP